MIRYLLLAACVAACADDTDTPHYNGGPCPEGMIAGDECSGSDTCSIEGTGTCSQPPAGAFCVCTTAGWACEDRCPGACSPTQPADGDGCIGDIRCPYGTTGGSDAVMCSCVADTFTCEPRP